MMKYWLIFGAVFSVGCLDMLKQDDAEEEEEDEDDESSEEGDRQGDCSDGEDNDDDGHIDCEDQGCDGKPACESDDTAVVDTGEEDTDTDIDTGTVDTGSNQENPNNGECSDEIDNDSDGLTDCDDPDCSGAEECDEPVTAAGLVIQLTWQHSGDDLDLHLLAPGGTIETEFDCYYANCVHNSWGGALDWGQQGVTTDNPLMTLDDIEGVGPEEIQIESPQTDGEFTIVVHDYEGSSTDVQGDNLATITVYSGGAVLWTGTKTITGEGSYTDVATLNWGTQTVTPQ